MGGLCSLLAHRNFSDGVREVGDLPLALWVSIAWTCCLLFVPVTAVTTLRAHPGNLGSECRKGELLEAEPWTHTYLCGPNNSMRVR